MDSENNMELVIQADSVKLIGYNNEIIEEIDPGEMPLAEIAVMSTGQISEAIALYKIWNEAVPDEALVRKIDA